ncbi:hypothetical protein BDP27DRAFT_1319546 [Rhodocollybia butyracea]|uniref:Uncharacterized protein n=1 Tax=Rhodocollybia butyracea TaxID=206335 RepID=A0A9P5UBA0_9AGAR|nr:hypothetical protein BDP27DRAFT_1319546 [Rhodocollybia butyracea]
MSFTEQRPGIRRKSSAQNLLSSFKPNSGTQPAQPLTVSSSAAAAYTGPSGAPTPISSTPLAKEWDSQSLHAESSGTTTPSLGQGTSDEYLRDLVQKRILTLTYIRNIHEGRSHWFHTIYISRADLDRVFNNVEMKKRTTRFLILGMSLANLLDVPQPQDFLRGLLNTLVEYDQAKEDPDKPKIRQPRRLFRGKLGGKRPGVLSEYSGSYADSAESYLVTPHTPFPLDYHQTLLSLLDIVSEVYNKISKLIGPSPIAHSTQHMMGPLGLLVPHPGVSYLFSDAQSAYSSIMSPSQQTYLSSDAELHGNLWSIANGGASTGSFSFGATPAWSSSLGELVLRVDNKFKKITSILLKELDQFARAGIKEELASLDPLLRNIKMPDLDAAALGNFEGM